MHREWPELALEPADVALHAAVIEPKRPFAVRAQALLMELIADIVGDTEDAAGSPSRRGAKSSQC